MLTFQVRFAMDVEGFALGRQSAQVINTVGGGSWVVVMHQGAEPGVFIAGGSKLFGCLQVTANGLKCLRRDLFLLLGVWEIVVVLRMSRCSKPCVADPQFILQYLAQSFLTFGRGIH